MSAIIDPAWTTGSLIRVSDKHRGTFGLCVLAASERELIAAYYDPPGETVRWRRCNDGWRVQVGTWDKDYGFQWEHVSIFEFPFPLPVLPPEAS